MSKESHPPANTSREVSAFLDQVSRTPVRKDAGKVGRLIFALDATASREPTWDTACELQAGMFIEAGRVGGLEIQLAYYRGFRQFEAGNWCTDTASLTKQMTAVRCLGGETQIARILDHALKETGQRRVQALVFVGDAIEEDADSLCHRAGQLGLAGLPVFIFQEGHSPPVRSVFQQIAKLSGGAYAPFDTHSGAALKTLLSAVAIFAAGGRKALMDYSKTAGRDVLLLTQQLK